MKSEYCLWIAVVAFVLAVFSCAIMVVGYQPLTFGRAATVVVLLVVAAVSLFMRRKGRS